MRTLILDIFRSTDTFLGKIFLSFCIVMFVGLLANMASFGCWALFRKASQWWRYLCTGRKPRTAVMKIRHPSSPFWRRAKARWRLMKWIFWTERKKRYAYRIPSTKDGDVWDSKQRRWRGNPALPPLSEDRLKPLKNFLYEMGFFGALIISLYAVAGHPEFFFPSWVSEFPARAELLEVSGTLRFHRFHYKGAISYFTITPEQRGIGEVRLRCRSGPSGLSGYSCSDRNIPKHLDWSKTVARYHPQWGLIELIVDGSPVQKYTYEFRKSFVEKMGRQAGYTALISFSIIIFYFAHVLRFYRRRRAEYAAAARARKKRVQSRN